jgi:hypothetical protein
MWVWRHRHKYATTGSGTLLGAVATSGSEALSGGFRAHLSPADRLARRGISLTEILIHQNA